MEESLLVFTEISDGGGIQVVGKNFLEIFKREDFDRKINIVLLKNKVPPKGDYKNVKFYCCGSDSPFVRRLKFVIHTSRILFRKNIKKIFFNHINLVKPFSRLLSLLKKRYSFVVYGIEIWNPNRKERNLLWNAEEIYSPGNFTYSKIKKFINPKTEVKIFSPMADAQSYYIKKKDKALLKKYNLSADSKIILTVSRLSSVEKYKGYDKIIEILPELKKSIKNIKYILVGTGDDELRIRELTKNNNLEKDVILTGFVEKDSLIDYYNLCDVFSMPSMGEGFGIVFVEALLCGKPVIAGNKDGSIDALLNGKLGILVDPSNKEELCSAFKNLFRKKVSKRFFNKNFLRREAIKAFGEKVFYSNAKNIVLSLN